MDNHRTIRDHMTFRVILQAMSHPGKVYRLPEFEKEETAVIELLSCLLDNEMGIAVLGDQGLARKLTRHTGCRVVDYKEADWVIVGSLAESGEISALKKGSLEYPDRGATILYLVDGLSEVEGGISVTGPGVKGKNFLRISGLAAGELVRLQQLNSQFPLGVDALFFVPRRNGRIACIPRSSQIGEN